MCYVVVKFLVYGAIVACGVAILLGHDGVKCRCARTGHAIDNVGPTCRLIDNRFAVNGCVNVFAKTKVAGN